MEKMIDIKFKSDFPERKTICDTKLGKRVRTLKNGEEIKLPRYRLNDVVIFLHEGILKCGIIVDYALYGKMNSIILSGNDKKIPQYSIRVNRDRIYHYISEDEIYWAITNEEGVKRWEEEEKWYTNPDKWGEDILWCESCYEHYHLISKCSSCPHELLCDIKRKKERILLTDYMLLIEDFEAYKIRKGKEKLCAGCEFRAHVNGNVRKNSSNSVEECVTCGEGKDLEGCSNECEYAGCRDCIDGSNFQYDEGYLSWTVGLIGIFGDSIINSLKEVIERKSPELE